MSEIENVINEANGTKETKDTEQKKIVKSSQEVKIMSEVLESLGLTQLGSGFIRKEHTEEELDSINSKNQVINFLQKTKSDKASALSELSYESLLLLQKENRSVTNPTLVDGVQIGDNKSQICNVVFQRMINDNYSNMGQIMKNDAAHVSFNIQRSSDSGEFSVQDKELVRAEPAIFTHRSSYVEDGAIVQVRPEGQMEATAIIVNEGYPGYDTLVSKFTEYTNILSIKSAQGITGSKEEVIKKLRNLIFILNKGSIRNMIDNRVLAALSIEDAKNSTKAERYEVVTNIMQLVNSYLGTFALSPYVATCELSDWTYSIMDKGNTYSKSKGRKYFELENNLIMKVDMRGSKAGGKYPIQKEYIDEFKTESAKLQRLFFTIMENAARSDLGLDLIELPKVEFKDSELVGKYSKEKVVSFVLDNNKITDISALELLEEAEETIKKAVDKAFDAINEDRVTNSL